MLFTKQRVLPVLIAMSGLLLLWIYCSFFKREPEQYITFSVKRGNIESSILTSGTIKPHRLVAVGARTTGLIISLKVRPGTLVKKGDLLAELDSTAQNNELKNKRAILSINYAQLDEQKAKFVLAQKNLEREQDMINSHAISKADLDNAEAQVQICKAEIKALNAQITQSKIAVETARINLSYTRITAPFDATVLATLVQEGQTINAVQSIPTVVILGDLSMMTVHTEISEADIMKVKPKQNLYFNVIGNPNRSYQGTLTIIEPTPVTIRDDISFNSNINTLNVQTTATYYNGIFNIENKDGELRTYMTAEVHIILGKATNVLLIPADILKQPEMDGLYKVYVLQKNNTIIEKKIKIGINNKAMAEVLSGLAENDRLILESQAEVNSKKRHIRLW
ncbi:MAG: macrolide-specific efflux system [Candidatus Tokpelaia sp. JSC161]|jgi:macrolide-specific efflux system membrane fusion protein|nr:MAG: macrolide-specific efflux system [Candidatus Tokpelaia sp. JSC161]